MMLTKKLKESGKRITEPGMHHFRRGEHRIHLRISEDGRGILTVDASRIIHFNPVAVDMTWMILSEIPEKKILRSLRKRYSVKKKQVASDLEEFGDVLQNILNTGASEPISFVNMEVTEPFQAPVEVPYRMDLALTYRCNINCSHCYNQTRDKNEFSTDQWKTVMNKIWDLGIPHVIFTGGESTLRDDLEELIQYAETLGLVTGLLTNGVKLANEVYLQGLLDAGLDHIQITLESSNRDIHNKMTGADSFDSTVQGIRNCVKAGIHTITNTTITEENYDGMAETIQFAHDLGLSSVAANAIIHSGKALEGDFAVSTEKLENIILLMNEKIEELGMKFIWYSPTRYCSFNPLEFDLGAKRCTAGEYNLCIEPDGEVLPCQSWYESAGNILTVEWDSIWNSDLMKSARNREWIDDVCRECVDLSLCGGGCPLEKKNGAPCRDSM
ncbi:MAG: radical SAM protein [Candidatus Sabulitectum sp.]|nr:radical SAM protein [Candidatus Sabulitectum sp.]